MLSSKKNGLPNGIVTNNYLENKAIFLALFSVYMILRSVAWKTTILIDTHDSISYLEHAKLFLANDFNAILNLNPDSTLLYPFFIALCSLPGWCVETGARLCSLFFSLGLFGAIYGIGKHITRASGLAIGLLILSVSPVLVFLSISILTEPSYIALIYLGFWLFMTQYQAPVSWKSGLLGIIFGLSFLCRTEGFLYLAIIPLFQVTHFLIQKRRDYDLSRLVRSTIIFAICFSVLAVPQIWQVSSKMGRLAINGRQTWIAILDKADGKSYDEKIRGLDYSPKEINLRYIQRHPEVMTKQVKGFKDFIKFLRKVIYNLNDLFQNRLPILIGYFGSIFFVFGLIALHRSGRSFEVILILAFIVLNLVPPLMHNVVIRHIAVIAPIIMLVEGIGIAYIYRSLSPVKHHAFLITFLIVSLFLVHLGTGCTSMAKRFVKPPKFDRGYNPDDFREPVKLIKQIWTNELSRSPNVLARKAYFAYLVGTNQVWLPHTTYEGLVKYCFHNDVDFLFLQHRLISEFPFLVHFLRKKSPPHFFLLYRAKDHWGKNIELYRFRKTNEIHNIVLQETTSK